MARVRGFPRVLPSLTVGTLEVTGTATFASTVTVTTSISSPLYTSAANAAIALNPGDNASATDTAGANVTVSSGKGRGAGAASSIVFQTPTVAASGTTLQSLATRLTVATAGITATVPVLAADGAVGAPSIAFSSSASTGFFYSGALIQATISGVCYYAFGTTSGLRGASTTGYGITAGAANASASDVVWTRHSAANWRQGFAAAVDVDGVAQTLRSPGGGTVSAGTTGKNGGAYTITAGAGSDAKAGSNANGGNGGILTLTGGAKGLKDGGGADGLDGGVQVSRTGGLLGFYGTAPVALQTGVAVSAAGVHAALVNLGLITA